MKYNFFPCQNKIQVHIYRLRILLGGETRFGEGRSEEASLWCLRQIAECLRLSLKVKSDLCKSCTLRRR